jgi:hypothetical protein
LLTGFECILPTSQSLAQFTHPCLVGIDLVFSDSDSGFSTLEFFGCVLSEHRRLIGGVFTEHTEQLPVDEHCDGSTHRDPGSIAIPLPSSPLRPVCWHPQRPKGLIVTESGEELAVDPRHDAPVHIHQHHL